MGTFVAIEIGFPSVIVQRVMKPTEEEMYTLEIYHTYYSKQNNVLSQFCENSRVIKYNSELPNRISGIVEAFNKSDKLILFYNQIQYTTGLDLAVTLGYAYNKPMLIINGKSDAVLVHDKTSVPFDLENINLFYNMKSSVKKIVNAKLINYTLNDITNKSYNLDCVKENLRSRYNSIKDHKISRRIILLE